MKTIALRFGEHFAPEGGTIAAHQSVINKYGFVWYGKLGSAVSKKVAQTIMENDNPKILLIRSGKSERYWAFIESITKEQPDVKFIPPYYGDKKDAVNTWFKVVAFEDAPKDIMARCTIASSGAKLGEASKRSMSPYFIINYEE